MFQAVSYLFRPKQLMQNMNTISTFRKVAVARRNLLHPFGIHCYAAKVLG